MSKILIVEDDPLMSRMYQKIFSFENYKMNGLDVLDKLKLDPSTKSIPVVMLTNLAGQRDAETAMAKGAVKYIIKSEYEPKQVADMIKEILAGYTRDEVPESA